MTQNEDVATNNCPYIHDAFQALLEAKEKEINKFQENRGKFQSALGDIGASETIKHKLRTMARG